MGVLQNLAETGGFAPSNNGHNIVKVKESLIDNGAKLFDSHYSKYKELGTQLESTDIKEQYRAATTLYAIEQVKNYLESMKTMFGEAVVTASLGSLVPRILDIVRS